MKRNFFWPALAIVFFITALIPLSGFSYLELDTFYLSEDPIYTIVEEDASSDADRLLGEIELRDNGDPSPNEYFKTGSSIKRRQLEEAVREREQQKDKELEKRFFQVSQSISNLSAVASGGMTSAVNDLGHHFIDQWWLDRVGFLPDWAKRIELEWELRDETNFEFEALTIQPLYQANDKSRTLFTQIVVRSDEKIGGDRRTTTNFGLGYRHLLAQNTVLAGANVFYDREWGNEHDRIGFGMEARWNAFDLYANLYQGLSITQNVVGDTVEEALDGYDVEMTTQVPYLPWMRVRGKGFWWLTDAISKDVQGWTASAEMDLTRNFLVEWGASDDNFNDLEYFVKLRFTVDHDRPTMVSNLVDREPFRMRDMSRHTLDRVRRENSIIIEKSSASGVVVTRGN